MAFIDIAGNIRVRRILKLSLQRDRVPNSLLFCGPEGVGKKKMALTLAKALNCLRETEDSCDQCPSCLAIDGGRFPDVMVMAPERKEIGIDQIRFLKQMAYLRPMTGKKRVFVLAEADRMSDEAANSLLKVLEEPPPFSHIILVAASPFLLPATIRSRCQSLAFSAVTKEEIEEILVEREYGQDQARIISVLVDGNLERALEIGWDEVQALKEESWALFEAMVSGRRASAFIERFGLEKFGGMTRETQEELGKILELFATFSRDILLLTLGGEPKFLLNPDFEPRLRAASGTWPVRRVLDALAELDGVLADLGGNLNKGLVVATFFSNFGELRHV